MATRFYLPSSGSAPVTPATWNHANQAGTTYTLPGVRAKTSTAHTTRTTATGTTSPYVRAVSRYVIGPLNAVELSGTVNLVMLCRESATGANATMSLAVKFIQPDGSDRSILLAATASDSPSSPYEYSTTLSSRRAYDVSEARPIELTQQTPVAGDYLVVEVGFRSQTTTSRNVDQRHGDTSANDLADGEAEENDYCPWVEFSGVVSIKTDITPSEGVLTATGNVPIVQQLGTNTDITPEYGTILLGESLDEITPVAGEIVLTGDIPAVPIFVTPSEGVIALVEAAPTIAILLTTVEGSLEIGTDASTPVVSTVTTPLEGSLDVVGTTTEIHRDLATVVGELALATDVSIPVIGVVVTPVETSLLLAGVEPIVPILLFPTEASLTITGDVSVVTVFLEAVPSAGTIALSGNVPVINAPSDTEILPVAGTLEIIGSVPEEFYTSSIDTVEGSLTLEGASGLLAFALETVDGSIEYVEDVAILEQQFFITPDSVSVVITGDVPVIPQTFEISTVETSIGLAGNVSSVINNSSPVIIPLVGEIFLGAPGATTNILTQPVLVALTGQTSVISRGSVIAMDTAGSMHILYGIPILVHAGPVSIDTVAGSLAISGNVSLLGNIIEPIAGAVALTGDIAIFETMLTTIVGELLLTENVPLLNEAGPVEITTVEGELGLSENAAVLDIAIVTVENAVFIGEYTTPTIIPLTANLWIVGGVSDVYTTNPIITTQEGSLALVGDAPVIGGLNIDITPEAGTLTIKRPTFVWTWTPSGGSPLADWRFEYGKLTGNYTQFTLVTNEDLREIDVRQIITVWHTPSYTRLVALDALGNPGAASNEVLADPNISQTFITREALPSAGTLSLVGSVPDVVKLDSPQITPVAGSIEVVGDISEIAGSYVSFPTAGQCSLSGSVPDVVTTTFYVRVIEPGSASVVLSSDLGELLHDIIMNPLHGNLGVVGDLAELLANFSIITVEGLLAVAGEVSTPEVSVATDTEISPLEGSLAYVGEVSDIDGPREVTPEAGTLTLTAGGAAITDDFSEWINWDGLWTRK